MRRSLGSWICGKTGEEESGGEAIADAGKATWFDVSTIFLFSFFLLFPVCFDCLMKTVWFS